MLRLWKEYNKLWSDAPCRFVNRTTTRFMQYLWTCYHAKWGTYMRIQDAKPVIFPTLIWTCCHRLNRLEQACDSLDPLLPQRLYVTNSCNKPLVWFTTSPGTSLNNVPILCVCLTNNYRTTHRHASPLLICNMLINTHKETALLLSQGVHDGSHRSQTADVQRRNNDKQGELSNQYMAQKASPSRSKNQFLNRYVSKAFATLALKENENWR